MKKKSIFITGIVLALLVFAGCSEPSLNLPRYVVSADVKQTQDFIVGQAFDPSKFEVTVHYSDGSTDVLSGQNITSGVTTCAIGTTASVNAGLNKDGSAYQKTFAVNVYEATGVTVTVAPESATVANDEVKALDANLFTVEASYVNGTITLLPNVDYTVSIDASGIGAGETKTVTATVDVAGIFDTNPTVQVAVTNAAEGTPVTPLDDYVWNNELAYSITDSYAFNREAFDADNFQLYRVYRKTAGASLNDGYYLMPVDATFSLAADAEAYAATGTTETVSVSYKYVPEGVSTGAQTELTAVAFSVDPSKYTADAEGRLVPNKGATGAYSNSSAITMNLSPDYVTDLAIALAEGNKLYVGETATGADFAVTATYASGYVDAASKNVLDPEDEYSVNAPDPLALDSVIKITYIGTLADNSATYGVSNEYVADVDILDYIVSFKATLKSSVKTPVYSGQVLGPESFDFSEFVMASDPEKKVAAPAGVEYEMYNTLIPESDIVGGFGNFWINAKFNGKTVMSNAVTVAAVADQPASVAFKKIPEKVTVNTAYTDSLGFEYTVTWKSGNTYSSTWPVAPTVTYTYEPTTSASEAKTEEVTVTWSCNDAEGEIKTNINVVAE